MGNIVFGRTIALSRASHISDATSGSAMVESVYATKLKATIQPKRDRNLTPMNYPGSVSTESADSMTTWKIILFRMKPAVKKNDIITDDAGVKYIVEVVYPTAMGLYMEGRITQP